MKKFIPSFTKKQKILFLTLTIINLVVIFASYFIISTFSGCVFAQKKECIKGIKYQKYNWDATVAKSHNPDSPIIITAPFDGSALFSPTGIITYEGKLVGKTPTLTFKSENGEVIKIYVAKANLLKGELAVEQKVSKGEAILEVLPEKIEFLDDKSIVVITQKP
jgi:hypothetical protein